MILQLPPLRLFAGYVTDLVLLLLGYVSLRYLIPKAARHRPAETFVGLVAVLLVLAVLFMPLNYVLLAGAGLAVTLMAYVLNGRRQERRTGRRERSE